MRKLLILALVGLGVISFAETSQLEESEQSSRIQTVGHVELTATPPVLSQQPKRLKVVRDTTSIEYWFVRVQNDRSRIPLAGLEQIPLATLRSAEVILGDRLNNTARVSLSTAFPGARVYRVPERELTKHFGPQTIPITGSQTYEMVEPIFKVKCSVQKFYYAPVPHAGWFGSLPVGRTKSLVIYIVEPVECSNTCGCPNCMSCTATHTWDGTTHPTIMPLEQYFLEPEIWHSCNSKNVCNDFEVEPEPGPFP